MAKSMEEFKRHLITSGWQILATIAGFIVLTWLLELFINSNARAWTSAIQASSTFVLVIVTGAYVVLTSRILNVQREQVTSSAREIAIRNVSVLLTRNVRKLLAGFRGPFDLVHPPSSDLVEYEQFLSDFGQELHEQSNLLPPDLAVAGISAALQVSIASNRLMFLLLTCAQQESENMETGRDWSVDDVKTRWYMNNRETSRDQPEWDELVNGKIIEAAIRAIEEFRGLISQRLLGTT